MHAPLYPASAAPRDGSKGRRKDARRNVRAALGTSSDGAPSLTAALQAAESLRRIIDLASNGRYGLAIVRPTFEGEITQERLVEEFTFDSGRSGTTVVYPGDLKREKSSLVHEPVTDTVRRERHLREVSRNNRGIGFLIDRE